MSIGCRIPMQKRSDLKYNISEKGVIVLDMLAKQSVVVLTPTFNHPAEFQHYLHSIEKVLKARPDVQLELIDNASDPPMHSQLRAVANSQIRVHFLTRNVGKGNALNEWLKTHPLDESVQVVVSIDPDITFSPDSFDRLVAAAIDIPKLGYLSMRYTSNRCNPELGLWRGPRQVLGKSGRSYRLRYPVFANVAGGIIAIPRSVLANVLNGELYPNAEGKIYYGDEVALYLKLKKQGYRSAYLEGTEATHLKSGPIRLI